MDGEYQMRMAVVLIVSLFSAAAVSALDIYVAPILYVDETADNSRNTSKVQGELIAALRAVETGVMLQFDSLKDNEINPPVSLSDAVTVCRNEQIEYLLYGYVTRRTNNVLVELRLFEYSSRVVMKTFFGMDDPEHYERLIEDMTMKILKYIGEKFNLEIIPERINVTQLKIPVIVGYWTPIGGDWVSVMLGTVAAGSGLVLIPTDNLFMIKGMPCYLSTGLEIKYRLGVGNVDEYEAYNHTLYMMMPLRLHVSLTPRHQVYMGLGYIYFLEFFSFADKYDDSGDYIYNNMGLNISIGYQFHINRILSIFFRNDFDFLFNEHSLITYSPSLGLDIKVYEREIKKRW
jgi:TolB-like protein